MLQETQLSQTDRAKLRATEYFAKSLKVIRNETLKCSIQTMSILVTFLRYSATRQWKEF